MKYIKQQRMDIGHKLYTHELSISEAMSAYGIGESTAWKYLTEYKRENDIPLADQKNHSTSFFRVASTPDIDTYMAMSKEELINELILAKANELRAKKGYEVKGVGANKEFVSLNNKNMK